MSFSEWKKYKLGEVCETVSETHKTKNGKLIFLNTGDIEKGKILHQEYSFVSGMPGQAKKSIKFNDILFSEIRPANGRWAFINFDSKDYIVSTKLMVIRGSDKIHPKFLYQLLTSSEITKWLQHLAESRSGTFPQITFTQVSDIEVNLPPIKVQNKISSFLDALDDKIELNRQTNKTLETIAQTLFKEMCLPKGEELPDGWRVEKLGDLIDTVSVTHKMKQERIIFLNTSDILEGNVLHNDYSIVKTLPGQAKKSIKRDDILFSEIRPANKRYAFVNFDADDYVVSTKLMVLRSKGKISPYLIYCYLTNNDTLNQLQHLAETRSGTFPQITFTQLVNMELVIPSDSELDKLTQNIKSIYNTIFSNQKEISTLSTIRDGLLPKLMKGEIEI